jgi:hypothetical protein
MPSGVVWYWRRRQADSDLEGLRVMSTEKEHANKRETAKVDRLHVELERLNGTLRQIEAYNEQMKGEIQVRFSLTRLSAHHTHQDPSPRDATHASAARGRRWVAALWLCAVKHRERASERSGGHTEV